MWSPNHWKIRRVPALLLAEEEKKKENDYSPKVVAIGPYHRGKPELAVVEAFKPMAVDLFVRGPVEKQYFYHIVLGMIGEVRSCYEEDFIAEYSDADFAQMMLEDASLIIIHMEIYAEIEHEDLQNKWYDMIESIGRLTGAILFHDFFLVENQIPLPVIESLIKLRHGERIVGEMISKYANLYIFGEYHRSAVYLHEALHLVEVMHRVLTTTATTTTTYTIRSNGEYRRVHARHYARALPPRKHAAENWTKKVTHSFRRVTDLKAKGIHFRPSETRSLNDVEFESHLFRATLHLPEWFVSHNTKPFFKNMVAYELLQDALVKPVVTSYIELMKSLLEKPEDVKELRERRVLYNQIGSDEEVVQVYKDINTHGTSDEVVFLQVRDRIQAHYNSRIKTWIAELIHTHFRSPWTGIAFLAATAIIALTAAQLYYAAHPPHNS